MINTRRLRALSLFNYSSTPAIIASIVGALLLSCLSVRTTRALELVADAIVFNNGNVNADALKQQFRAQFEPMLRVELSFINRVCKLTDDERRKLIAKSNKWLEKFIGDYAKQGGQAQFQGAWFAGQQPQQPPDPRESIRAGLEVLVKAELPKDKVAIYADESKKRSEFARSAAVDNLVMRLDKELFLSPEQRQKLAKSLSDHWDKNWGTQLEMVIHGVDACPNVPDQFVRPHLNATQQVAWINLQRRAQNMFFPAMGIDAGQVIDDIDLKEGEPQAMAENADPNSITPEAKQVIEAAIDRVVAPRQ